MAHQLDILGGRLPQAAQQRADLAELGLGVLLLDGVAIVVGEQQERGQRALGCIGVLREQPVACQIAEKDT
jgi:hypothetical protein